MTKTLAIAIAQLNPIVGDVTGNRDKVVAAWESAADRAADIVLYSELVLSGYPPEDLVDRKSTRLNSSHITISYAVFCLKKKKKHEQRTHL